MTSPASSPMLAVVAGTLLVTAAYAGALVSAGPPRWAMWSMVGGIALLMTGVMALGARRPGRSFGRLRWVFGFVALVLVGCFGAALVLPAKEGAEGLLVLGLPPRAALVMLGVGLLPAAVLPLAYAWTFDRRTLRCEDLERVKRARSQGPDPDR